MSEPARRGDRPAAAPADRPRLRVVPPAAPRARVRMVLTLSTVVVFAVLLLAAAVHTTIVSGQRELDRVDERISEATRQNQGLRLRVAELESPERIVEAASRDGMVVPEDVTWLSPEPTTPDPAGDAPPATGRTDERAVTDPTGDATGGAQG